MKKRREYIIGSIITSCIILISVIFIKNSFKNSDYEKAYLNETVVEGNSSAKSYVIDKAGVYSDNTEYETINITVDGVIVENMSAKKIIVKDSVGEGDVTLRNIKTDELLVYGGGENSIHIEDSSIGSLLSAKEESKVRIVINSNTSVKDITLKNSSILENEGSIKTLSVLSNSVVKINGTIDIVNISENALNSLVHIEGKVNTLNSNKALSQLKGIENIENVKINESSSNSENKNNNSYTINTTGNSQKPIESDKNTEQGNSIKPDINVEPENPVVPEKPVEPGNPVEPEKPVEPDNPVEPENPQDEIFIELVQTEPGKVVVTLSQATSSPVLQKGISILCNSGGADMTILGVTTKDNKVYEITTAYYKDNLYEIYMDIPEGTTISKVFEVRTDAPTLSNINVERINEGNADFFFVSDSQGTIYYLLQERTNNVSIMRSSVPSSENIKADGIKKNLRFQSNAIRINNLKSDTEYEIYYLLVDEDNKESLVQGPVIISANPVKEPELNEINIIDAKATNRYFDITLDKAPTEELTLDNLSISCPASSQLHLGKIEKLSDTKYRAYMKDGYFFMDKNHYTIVITYSDNTISKYKFYVDLSWPEFSLPKINRESITSAKFNFKVNEDGDMWYIILDTSDIYNTKVTVDEVISNGKKVSFTAGNNEIILEGITEKSKSLWFVIEDKLGNRPSFVDAIKIPDAPLEPETPGTPENPNKVTIESIEASLGETWMGKECTVIDIVFNEEFNQFSVGTADIMIRKKGSSSYLNGYRDLSTALTGRHLEISISKNGGIVLEVGEYDIEITLDDGSKLNSTFTIN
ncbi:hypothetical protein PMY12_08735 [Clostridium tertium]|uniref:hypothetical protein n=1 Tax=Clostridium tertium TaxID=1559 RepID=UPI00232D4C9F|nr:hypothetical protein [Clostridium tertium]MDB1934027.1 hypothetical protein [Clostridium tertium]MDB1937098.1 hypothetical protein [Clostridium tertium]